MADRQKSIRNSAATQLIRNMSRYQLDAYDYERVQAAQEELQANADSC